MAREFDNFPTYDPIIKDKVYLSNVWADFMATFIESLNDYLSQYGIFVPQLTTAQRDEIQVPVRGQLIYNTTTNKFQGYESNVWVNLV